MSEVVSELDDSEFEGENDSSDDDFEGYIDGDMFDEYDEESIEGELNVGREEIVESVGEEDERVDDRVEEDYELEGEQSGQDDEMQVVGPSVPEYTLEPGCTPLVSSDHPIDYFGLMVDDGMLQHVVDQTNLSADQYLASHDLAPHSRICRWRKTSHDITELKRFLVLVLVMGLVRLPQIEHHWCVSWPYCSPAFSSVRQIFVHALLNKIPCKTYNVHYIHTYVPYAHVLYTLQVMKRDRFSLLMKFLHLNDNEQYIRKGQPGHDPLYKLRPFLQPLLTNFQHHYTLHREVSVDETMIGFKGRLGFLQYMPKKPTKWGLKAFVLSDAHSGYIYNWNLYTGRSNSAHVIVGKCRQVCMGSYIPVCAFQLLCTCTRYMYTYE